MNLNFKIRTAQRHFWKKHRVRENPMDNTWLTLWLVTLANHNVTRVQKNKKIL